MSQVLEHEQPQYSQINKPKWNIDIGQTLSYLREMKKVDVNNQEKDTLDSYEQGQFRPVKNRKLEIKKLRQYARNTLQESQEDPCQPEP